MTDRGTEDRTDERKETECKISVTSYTIGNQSYM